MKFIIWDDLKVQHLKYNIILLSISPNLLPYFFLCSFNLSLWSIFELCTGFILILHFLLGLYPHPYHTGSLAELWEIRTDRHRITASMASSVLEILKEEVTCPICLELQKEPMSADCNHSFCRACITLNYESNRNTEGEPNCPVCRIPYSFGNLRHNRHVANIVERLEGVKSIPEEEQKVNVCAQHGEKLQLFCRKDMMAICWLCERSQEHRGHQTALIEEVGQEYKVRSWKRQETKQKQ